VDWTHGAQHMRRKHGVGIEEANEALTDVAALLFDPDPKSKSGSSARLIGYSPARGQILVIILVRRDDRAGAWWGANGWPANNTDSKIYREENTP
jgi:uncharacterized DUF497 family protein